MLTDADLCVLSALTYTSAPTWSAGDVHAVRTDRDGLTVVAFRGTVLTDLADWLRDLDAWPAWHRGLGICHAGFLHGAEQILPAILRDVGTRRLVLTGHSLGGALAVATAGLLALAWRPPAALVTFGAPRVGFRRLRRLLRDLPVRQYVDGDDPVPEVPWPYWHARRPIAFGAALPDPLAAHAIALYGSRLAELEPVYAT